MATEMVFELNTDKSVVVENGSSQRVVELRIKAPLKESVGTKIPLNLALVIDRSGSMNGVKLDFARRAALHVIDLLDESDRLALVAYDDEVNRIFPSVRLTPENRADLRKAVQGITSGGSTNLSGGWLTGCQEIAETQVENGLNRALLLTDGLANVGIVDPVELGYHASQLMERGISTTTLGIGMDFDHFLLENMADKGGGNYYFIEDAPSITAIFQKELSELLDITARAVEIVVRNPSGTRVQVCGGWQSRVDDSGTHIQLGDLASAQEKRVYLRFDVSADASGKPVVLPVLVRARGEQDQLFESTAGLEFACVSNTEEADASVDEALMQRFVVIDTADAAHEALIMEREGRRSQARDLLRRRTQVNSPYLSRNDVSSYEALSQRMEHGMDEFDRKSSHYNGNLRRRMREQ